MKKLHVFLAHILLSLPFILIPLVTSAHGDSEDEEHHHMMEGFDSIGTMGYGWLWMVIFWVVMIAVIIGVILLIFQVSSPQNIQKNNQKSPLNILEERYAKGKINQEEFEKRKKILSNK